jgi:hypothetical protein
MQVVQGCFGKHYLITLEFKNESVVNRKIDMFNLCECGWRRKICKARAFKYADSLLPGEYRAI